VHAKRDLADSPILLALRLFGDYGNHISLVWVALNGHTGVVKILLEQRDVNPDEPEKYGRTFLL